MKKSFAVIAAAICGAFVANCAEASSKQENKYMLREITYPCKIDNSMQPAMYRRATGSEPRPLLVGLHTWSYDHKTGYDNYAAYAEKYNWNMIFPKFRGPNWTREACGSDYVVSDIEDAVRFVCSDANVDTRKIYLCGGSGGGHCALLLAARRPDIWAGVSAWCPPADLVRWYGENIELKRGYHEHIASACGGSPRLSEAAKAEAMRRSPVTWLPNARNICTIDISTGVHDGHGKGSVPVSQAIRAFNILADEKDRISEADIAFINEKEQIPAHLKTTDSDPAFGKHTIYLRRTSNTVRLTLFEGGHDLFHFAAAEWLAKQTRGEKPDWSPGTAAFAPEGNTWLTK